MLSSLLVVLAGGVLSFFAQMPSSTTYKLRDFSIGTGGSAGSAGGTYQLEGITGETSGQGSLGGTYTTKSGLQQTRISPCRCVCQSQ